MDIYGQQDSNIRKTWVLMTLFLLLTIGIGWFFSIYYGTPIILYIAIGVSIFANVFSYWYSDKIVLKLTGAKEVTRETHIDLLNIVENLSITAGLPMPKVYVVEDSAPNAFATGRDPEHAAIAVTTGLLTILEKEELEGVIAHEMAHVANRDILLSTVVVVLVGLIAILSDIFLRSIMYGSRHRSSDNGKGGVVLFFIGVVLAILTPIIAVIIQLAISRKREYLADSAGSLLTRYPEGLANALEKISHHSQPMQKATNATAHLFIANPFAGKKKKFLHGLFLTHPPMEERITRLRGK
jgi:heat shock protein HtpX